MSLYKNRSGGSLFRFKALTGYFKHLFDEKYGNSENKEPTGELQNQMTAVYVFTNKNDE